MNSPDQAQQASPLVGGDAIILVVDDVAANRQVLASILRKAGYQVLSAATAQQALQQLSMQVPDLIMLDIMMPGLDGFALCRKLRSELKTQQIPIIFLSALDSAKDKVKAFEAGGADYVTKPYHAEEVLARVAHQIKIARLQNALEREKAELLRANQKLIAAQRQTASVFNALSASLPGQVLDGKYRIESKIGSGGFGVVYRAMHVGLQRAVAVKVFRPPAHMANQDALSRFQIEGISACRVNHPNAVAVLDSGVSPQGIAYLVMELLNGPTLHTEMWRKRRLPLSRCLEIMGPLLEVLIAAHAAGIVHRDIKPENILLHQSPTGEVLKVLDFGIAKLLDADPQNVAPVVTSSNDFLGTPMYMAPERMDASPYDGSSDVFSTGVLLHEMLTGDPPFDDRDQPALKVMFNHLHGAPKPLRTFVPELPPSLEALILRTLEKDRTRRPTAQELRDELLRISQQEEATGQLAVPVPEATTAMAGGRLALQQLSPQNAAELKKNWLGNESDTSLDFVRPVDPGRRDGNDGNDG